MRDITIRLTPTNPQRPELITIDGRVVYDWERGGYFTDDKLELALAQVPVGFANWASSALPNLSLDGCTCLGLGRG